MGLWRQLSSGMLNFTTTSQGSFLQSRLPALGPWLVQSSVLEEKWWSSCMTNYNLTAHLNIIPAMQRVHPITQSNLSLAGASVVWQVNRSTQITYTVINWSYASWYTLLTRLKQKVYDIVSSLPVTGFDITTRTTSLDKFETRLSGFLILLTEIVYEPCTYVVHNQSKHFRIPNKFDLELSPPS